MGSIHQLAKNLPVVQAAFRNRIGPFWEVASSSDRIALLVVAGMPVDIHECSWLDLGCGLQDEILYKVSNCQLVRSIFSVKVSS
ncbi:hypothetical protein JYT97_00065 [Haliea sp. AH-315-K21]|uniref:Uncharacterized protein n=1 Tax=SAR86 cluster bacterium TaxID=2030880 RepID=A0A2A5CE22_9GAMM|nr:hypothetical protein [Haliea sp. AH-315-K21]MBN4075860.1 hypothetical protein [Gammaproteobacteria bacterium AH-315-E17]PCJ42099.1 MAG: hypothetical protein COA71_05770 [SAR86 cluster bacterium]